MNEANGVSDNPLIFAETDEALSGGNFHAEPVAFAADIIAHRDLRDRLDRRAAHRHAGRPGPVRPPAFLTPKPGLNSGFMIPQVTAAALVSENKHYAHPASVDLDPDLRQSGRPRLDGGSWRRRLLAAMAENAIGVIGIELLAAAQGCDFHPALAVEPSRSKPCAALLRREVPRARRRPAISIPIMQARRHPLGTPSGRARAKRAAARCRGLASA